nr:UPF0481 protein At3g47200-like [Ipomoea batatas]
MSTTNPSAYKPKLISIGPYYRIKEPGSENSIKRYFQEGFFGNTEGLEKRCQVKLTSLVAKARSCYAGSTKNISNKRLVEMLMRDGCFILQFLKSVKVMEKERNIVQTLKDMLLFENQIPFFVLFELHKLKQDKGDDAELLMELIELVKNCYESQVRKLTQPLLPCKYTPEKLPKHLLEVVHSLCVPTRSVPTRRSDEYCGGLVLQQIKTATELKNDGVSFKKNGQIHTATGLEKYGIRFNNTGELHSLFDMDINWYAMKIRCFRIDDFTETFLRNMIAYEEQSDFASKYFTDFVLFMSHLIKTPEDENLLCGRGIIDNIQNTDMVQLFKELIVKDNTSSLSTLSTLSGVIKKARLHCDSPPNKWTGKLIQEFINNPWATIIGIGAVFAMIVGIVVGIARVF